MNYTESLFNNGTEATIAGWIEVDGDSYEALIFLIEKQKDINKNGIFKPLNKTNVITIYNQTTWTH